MSAEIMETLNLYSCGGTGVNIGKHYLNAIKEKNSAKISPIFIDTSNSNLDDGVASNMCFMLEGTDGSGKVRSENYAKISDSIKQLLLKFKPTEFNVVLFSGSGGSGSVYGPLIASELIARGETVVCIVVGSDESYITANNTMNTLKSLEGISRKTGKPVVMHYRHNPRGKPRTEVDHEIRFAISALAIMASRQNKALDTMDIHNWINFDKVTSVKPRLACLEIFVGNETPWDKYSPISVASIYKTPDEPSIPVVPEYVCNGYVDLGIEGMENIHYVIDVDVVPKIAESIQRVIAGLEEVRSSRPKLSNLIGEGDQTKDDGMVI